MTKVFFYVTGFLLFLSACRELPVWQTSEEGWQFSRNSVAQGLYADKSSPSGFLLWRDDFESVWLRGGIAQGNLVMVSTFAGSRLEPLLEQDERTLMFKRSDFQKRGHYLLSIANVNQLDQLASLVHEHNHSCGGLEVLSLSQPFALSDVSSLYPLRIPDRFHSDAVASLLDAAKRGKIEAGIETLENLGTRVHSTSIGSTVSAKVLAMYNAAKASTGYKFSSEQVEQPLSDQKSLILRIEGTKTPDEVVIVGAHLDSINKDSSNYADAPGADDDASGIATLVEMFRVLAEAGATFERSVEFHAYAAEEVGLVGSRVIANDYRDRGVKVVGMMQIDMNAYHQKSDSETIYLVKTNTSPGLTRSLKALLTTYLGGDYIEKTLSAGTSDHKSWMSAGFAAAFPFEDPDAYNRKLHTPADTSANLNNTSLSLRFAKLGLAFVAHHAGLSDAVKEAKAFAIADDLATLPDDLKVAITGDTENASLQRWGIATDTDVSRVELCAISDKDATSCEGELLVLKKLNDDKGRARHGSETGMTIDGKYRLFGYNAADELIQARQIAVTK